MLGCLFVDLKLTFYTEEEIVKGLDSVLCKAWKLNDFLQRVSVLNELGDREVS